MENQGAPAAPRPGRIKYIVSQTWRFFFSILVPIVLLPVFLWKPEKKYEKAPYAVYLTLLMALYWISECIPLAITSLIPIVLVPLFGIADSDSICAEYFNHTIIFLFGGCVVALAFEYSDLHTRISLLVMKSLGAQPTTLLFGMMLTCMTLSCWMNNTSTTAMMVPVIYSVMDQYRNRLIPKETAAEMAEKFGGFDAADIPQYVESKATLAPKSINSRGKEVDTSEVPRTNKVEPAQTDMSTPNGPEDISMTDGGGTAEMGENAPSLNVILQPQDQIRDESTFDVGTKDADVAYWEAVIQSKKKYVRNLEIMFLNGVAVASNIGGTGVVTGSGTNLIATFQLQGYKLALLDGKQPPPMNHEKCFLMKHGYWELDFAKWIMLNFVPMLVNVLVSWAFLAVFYQGIPSFMKRCWRRFILRRPPDQLAATRAVEMKQVSTKIREAITAKYEDLGRTTFHQWTILGLFMLLVCLWILRNPMFGRGDPVKWDNPSKLPTDLLKLVHPNCLKTRPPPKSKWRSTWGWSRFFGDDCNESYLHDYVSTMFICFLLLVIPKDLKYYKNALKGGLGEGLDDPLLPFDFVAQHTPWGPLFMLGGGFGISKAIKESNFGSFLSDQLKDAPFLKDLSVNAVLGMALIFVAFLTSIASNTATAVIVSPILLGMARTKGVPPLYLLVPPIVGASYAFCLPISTPPNAIVYDKANMKQKDMFTPGIFLTVICNVLLFLMSISWFYLILGVSSYDGSCDFIPKGSNGTQRRLVSDSAMARSLMENMDM